MLVLLVLRGSERENQNETTTSATYLRRGSPSPPPSPTTLITTSDHHVSGSNFGDHPQYLGRIAKTSRFELDSNWDALHRQGIYESWIAWRVYAEAHCNVQLSFEPAQLRTDYPHLLVPVEANVDSHGGANTCMYIAMFFSFLFARCKYVQANVDGSGEHDSKDSKGTLQEVTL
ncbi:hypothetical protein RHMOL_Rhmol04G0259200 [Rhododendron molle]|uniref:Uncharacterized protein n=1 Tax=Rhododendron molle TaxID=49168 RepID=A0ACC0P4E5_RHOML|nr:hypothetical protein RHMOL_Rhmol04G0259200 [Rhododendron molle]